MTRGLTSRSIRIFVLPVSVDLCRFYIRNQTGTAKRTPAENRFKLSSAAFQIKITCYPRSCGSIVSVLFIYYVSGSIGTIIYIVRTGYLVPSKPCSLILKKTSGNILVISYILKLLYTDFIAFSIRDDIHNFLILIHIKDPRPNSGGRFWDTAL